MATVASKVTPACWRPRKRLWALYGGTTIAALLLSALADWRASHVLLINATNSLPNWAFVVHPGTIPERGEYLFFDPPHNELVQRHFGAKPQMFGKIVYGMPGDRVTHEGAIVTINGQPVARMKAVSSLGEHLTPGAVGTIPPGCYFAGSPHKDGFDSRYAEIGLVCARQIVGTGDPIL